MGTVYRAVDCETGAVVAVKMLNLEHTAQRERFGREAVLLATVAHAGIVRYIAHGITADGASYLVMDWVDGGTLSRHMRTHGLDLRETVAVVSQLAAAVAVVHQAGVIHRDIKPSNVIVKDGDLAQLVLLDFGIARSALTSALTRTGTVVGTPGYLAPEQARGTSSTLDVRCDVFALGCLLYECATGQGPFSESGELSAYLKVVLTEPVLPSKLNPDVPPELEQLILHMLRKDPAQRPADAGAVAALLAALPAMPPSERRLRRGDKQQREHQATFIIDPSARTPPPTYAFMVLATGDDDGDTDDDRTVAGPEADTSAGRIQALAEVATSFGARFERLDESFVAFVTGTGARSQGAERAAECALGMQRVAPSAAIVVSAIAPELDANDDLERTVQGLMADAISGHVAAMVDGVVERAIPIDPDFAQLLPSSSEFRVTQRGPRFFMRARTQSDRDRE